MEPENFVQQLTGSRKTVIPQLDWLTFRITGIDKNLYLKTGGPYLDDGYRNMYDIVFPYSWLGICKQPFLIPSKFNTPTGLTTEMVAEMAAKGMEIGSHTYSHSDLTKISSAQMKKELEDSKRVLEEITGQPINFLCYPSGRFDQKVIEKSKEGGYLAAVTTQMGKASPTQDPYQWKRVRINYSTTLAGFSKIIAD